MASVNDADQTEVVVRADNTRLQHQITDYHHLVQDAAKADAAEHKQSVKEAFRINKKAVIWSMVLSAALIMEGYDVVVIGSFYGHPAFLERFGIYDPGTGRKLIPADWQSALSNGAAAGGIVGLFINGIVSERYGAKKVMLTALAFLTAVIFMFFFANSLGMIVAAEVLAGIPWGIFQTLTAAYASEVCPIQLRGYLTSYINMCWGIGIFLSSGVVKATLDIEGDKSWQIPFALQWIWPVPLAIAIYFCPTSPWWLVRQGRYEDAEREVMRLTNPKLFSEADAKKQVAMMIHTTELEKQTQEGTSYIQCFKSIDRRRTEIAMMVFFMQLGSGQNLIGQGVQFLQQAGLGVEQSFSLNMALNSMFIIGTIASWGLLSFFGRRTLYIAGLVCMDIVLLVVGIMGFFPSDSASMASGSLLIVLNFVYNATLGPVCYVIISEVGSTRLRAKTIVLSRIAYQLANIVCGIIVPRMLSPTAWNWGPKSGLFWAGSCFLCVVYTIFRVPETRARSYGELDLLFENHIPAWRFKGTKVDQFDLDQQTGTTNVLPAEAAASPSYKKDGGEIQEVEDLDSKK